MDNETLVRDLLHWLDAAPRSHADVMSTWRSTCPRLTIWEDALDAGLAQMLREGDDAPARAVVTTHGRAFLASLSRRSSAAAPPGAVAAETSTPGTRT